MYGMLVVGLWHYRNTPCYSTARSHANNILPFRHFFVSCLPFALPRYNIHYGEAQSAIMPHNAAIEVKRLGINIYGGTINNRYDGHQLDIDFLFRLWPE